MAKSVFTKENAEEYGRLGGIKSGEARRKKREYRNIAQEILGMGIRKGNLDDFECIEEAKGKNLSVAESIYIAQVVKALKGDKQAAEFCFNYGNMKPAEKVELEASVEVEDNELTNLMKIMTDYKEEKKKED